MKKPCKLLSACICVLFACAVACDAFKNQHLVVNALDYPCEQEQTSETVRKYFLGPKSEQGSYWANIMKSNFIDYCGVRRSFAFNDALVDKCIVPDAKFDSQLQELKDFLRRNHPYYSPRYMAHMLSEQPMPSVLGYFLGILNNTNNSTAEASPATTLFEAEYCNSIAKMFGYNTDKSNLNEPISWTHLTSGGSVANLEALWISRYVNYAPMIVWDVLNNFILNDGEAWPEELLSKVSYVSKMKVLDILRMPPSQKTEAVKIFFDYFYNLQQNDFKSRLSEFIQSSDFNIKENGLERCNSALEKLNGRPIKPLYFVPYTAHYCFPKIVAMLGEGISSIVKVPVDANFRMDVDILKSIINRKLFEDNDNCDYYISAVVAVAGTTEEGAVDPIDKILDFREALEQGEFGAKASFWLHIDGAWGGFFKTILGMSDKLGDNRYFENYEYFKSLSDEEKKKINEVNNAYLRFKDSDSITIDPHKMGYIPYSAGAISFKNRNALILIKQLASYINDNYKHSNNGSIDTLADLNDIKAFSPYVFECSKSGAAAASCWFTEKLIPYNFDEKNAKGHYHGDIVFDSYKAAQQFYYYLKNFENRYLMKINNFKDEPVKLNSIVNTNNKKGVSAFNLLPISDSIDTNIVCFVAIPKDLVKQADGFSLTPCHKINGQEITKEQLVDYTINLNNRLYSKYSYQNNTSKSNNPNKFNYFLSKTDLSFYTQNLEKSKDSAINEIYKRSHDIADFVVRELGVQDDAKLKEKIRNNLKIMRVTIMNPWHNSVKTTNEAGETISIIEGFFDDIQREMCGILSEKFILKN